MEITLPIKHILQPRCAGGPVIVAEEDDRPVDGMLQRFTVQVNSLATPPSRCVRPSVERLPAEVSLDSSELAEGFVQPLVLGPNVHVIYETGLVNRLNGKAVETRSTFKGANFHRTDVIRPLHQ
ncbi:MAG: hypothetical protein AB7P04_07210 [Bacteriovoracia bacterium]